jgi:hypothetical protein
MGKLVVVLDFLMNNSNNSAFSLYLCTLNAITQGNETNISPLYASLVDDGTTLVGSEEGTLSGSLLHQERQ